MADQVIRNLVKHGCAKMTGRFVVEIDPSVRTRGRRREYMHGPVEDTYCTVRDNLSKFPGPQDLRRARTVAASTHRSVVLAAVVQEVRGLFRFGPIALIASVSMSGVPSTPPSATLSPQRRRHKRNAGPLSGTRPRRAPLFRFGPQPS